MAVKWTKDELAELQAYFQSLLIGTGVTGSLECHVDGSFTIQLTKKTETAPVSMNHSVVPLNFLQAKHSIAHAIEAMLKQLRLKI